MLAIALKKQIIKVVAFGAVSLSGLGIDLVLFSVLIRSELSPLFSNAISATTAVLFVYFASVRSIFEYKGSAHSGPLTVYILYQVLAVTGASILVSLMSQIVFAVVAKLSILPITFLANFFFMQWLVKRVGQYEI